MPDDRFRAYLAQRYGADSRTYYRYVSDANGLEAMFGVTQRSVAELNALRRTIYAEAERGKGFWVFAHEGPAHRLDPNMRSTLKLYLGWREAQTEAPQGRLLAARARVTHDHVREACGLVDANDLAWLYQRTGRREPHHRYVVVDGGRYPTKAFGYLVAQLAAGVSQTTDNEMTVAEAYAPLKRLGYPEVRGPARPGDDATAEAIRISYCMAIARPQQARFRQRLMAAYDGACALTGARVLAALEAAHVTPFQQGDDSVGNGLLLRADLHRLFDSGHLAFEPETLRARFSPMARRDYAAFEGRALSLPAQGPPGRAFSTRWKAFRQAWPGPPRGRAHAPG